MPTILWWIIVGLIAGWIIGKIMKGRGYGIAMDIILGIAGAIVGGFIMRLVGFGFSGGAIFTILVAIAGPAYLVGAFGYKSGDLVAAATRGVQLEVRIGRTTPPPRIRNSAQS